MKFLVAIPCYNCEAQISRTLTKLSEEWDEPFDVLVLDNGSSDNTLAVAREFLEKLSFKGQWRVCQNVKNYGLGGSQKLAIKIACDEGRDGLIVLHGDDQASPKDIESLVGVFKKESSSALGSRFMKGSALEGYQLTRILGNRALNIIFSLFCFRRISDLGSGLNLFSVKDLKNLDISFLSDSFNFNVDLLLALIEKKAPIKFVPIHWSESDQVSNARNFHVAFSMLKSLINWKIGRKRRKGLEANELKTKVIASKE